MNIVTLNVGGHIYTTARSTLTRYPDSMLGAMFGGDLETLRDDQGRYFIDRNGRMFEHVLNFLRTGQLVLPEDFKELPLLEMEADFYQIQPLIEALKTYKASCAHDFVVVRPSLTYPQFTVVSANTKEVENKVKDLSLKKQTRKMSNPNDIVSLNVGGHIYTTTRATLMAGSQSMLSRMVSQGPRGRAQTRGAEPLRDPQGRYFIDRDGVVFRHVLNFLRIGKLVLPEGFKELDLLEKEAEFYEIEELIEALRIMMGKDRPEDYYYDDDVEMSTSSDVVTLDVGGHVYRTTMTTLTRYPDSMLGAMFGGDFDALRDDQGRYFIDRDGTLFRHVLNFLRTGQLVLPEDFKELPLLEMEADFYQIQPLIEALKTYKASMYQRCAHDFVVVKPHKYPQYTVVSANTKEVENKVKELVQTLAEQLSTEYAWDQRLTSVKMSGSILTLNVGGHIYTTTRSTLTRYPDSMLGAMFGGNLENLWRAARDDQGRSFIDRDGTLFRHVLNFLRTSQLVLPEDFKELALLEIEADFYQIQPLIEALKTYKANM
ncbi:PREDICTED: BTB/POZ domain-containing protein KCTD19-like [Branchiostoma belcheri]|uniref:BTB/POZ domain-containing protein KCTD19-like n=1 Tax=Branchiostoma belcheri TaxID=7741 RepID=A0A6P4Y2R0_BRABE|nr:PREDICTED: BTB/POZ domain-containing protein KCTD19-like [Branchiostoma belcheri]